MVDNWFAVNLKVTRKSQCMSQLALSGLSGVNVYMINKYENDKLKPGLTNLLKLADALEVTVDELVYYNSRNYYK